MQQLSWLLGKWHFEDIQVHGEYWERGTRECILVLDDQYVWEIRNGDVDPETGQKSVGFVDTVSRKK